MREAAVAEAREAAVREAREKMDAELARMRSETEVTVARALNKVKLETEEAERLRAEEARLRADEAERLRAEEARLRAEEAERVRAEAEDARAEAERVRIEAQQAQEAFAAELARVRSEVESTLTVQLDAARAESERMHAAEASAARERAGVEAQLQAELDRLKFVAAQTRKADQSESRRATDQIKQLEDELARVHAQAEERQAAQLEELRVQMADMREAAAQQARAAAAEAVASEVARAAAQSNSQRKPNIIRMQSRAGVQAPPAREVAAREIEKVAAAPHSEERSSPSGDYYSLFQPTTPALEPAEEHTETAGAGIDYRRHAKWALPVAACLLLILLITNTGTAISTVSRFVTPAEKPALIVQPVNPEPFIEVVEQRVGSLKVESTPDGAEASVDGRRYGKTPVTIPDLEVGVHTLVLKSAAGTITRRVTIKSNQTTLLAEAIFSGWLAIFSPIPITVAIDGKPVSLTEDGRVMTTPGKHVVELVSERFNYRVTETLDVRPGETTPHTLTLPMGSVRVTVPEGAEIKVDGALASGAPAEGLSMSIGSHEISATHPSLGERRASVDVRHGAQTDVTLQFEP
jgi:PEGA domain